VTTLISVITVYAFAAYNGIGSMKEFTFPLIIGLICGTYSSIFIASPLWECLRKSRQRERLHRLQRLKWILLLLIIR